MVGVIINSRLLIAQALYYAYKKYGRTFNRSEFRKILRTMGNADMDEENIYLLRALRIYPDRLTKNLRYYVKRGIIKIHKKKRPYTIKILSLQKLEREEGELIAKVARL